MLSLLCEGLSDRGIADRLGIALATVKIHDRKIYQKLGVRSRLQAVVYTQTNTLSCPLTTA